MQKLRGVAAGPPLVRHFARGPKRRRPLGSGKVDFWRRRRRGICRRVSGHQCSFQEKTGCEPAGRSKQSKNRRPQVGSRKLACPKWGGTARKSSSATIRQTWLTTSTRLELFCGSRTPRSDAATPEKNCARSQIVEHLSAVGVAGPVKARTERGDRQQEPPKRKRRIGRPKFIPLGSSGSVPDVSFPVATSDK